MVQKLAARTFKQQDIQAGVFDQGESGSGMLLSCGGLLRELRSLALHEGNTAGRAKKAGTAWRQAIGWCDNRYDSMHADETASAVQRDMGL